jgi:hypothetical protein
MTFCSKLQNTPPDTSDQMKFKTTNTNTRKKKKKKKKKQRQQQQPSLRAPRLLIKKLKST